MTPLPGFTDPSPPPEGHTLEVQRDPFLGFITHYRHTENAMQEKIVTVQTGSATHWQGPESEAPCVSKLAHHETQEGLSLTGSESQRKVVEQLTIRAERAEDRVAELQAERDAMKAEWSADLVRAGKERRAVLATSSVLEPVGVAERDVPSIEASASTLLHAGCSGPSTMTWLIRQHLNGGAAPSYAEGDGWFGDQNLYKAVVFMLGEMSGEQDHAADMVARNDEDVLHFGGEVAAPNTALAAQGAVTWDAHTEFTSSAEFARKAFSHVCGDIKGCIASVGKHEATNHEHLRRIYEEAKDTFPRFADTLAWLLWHDILHFDRLAALTTAQKEGGV